MLSLALPLGLLALAALVVPAVIHLWRPPPQVVRMGSLRLLRGNARPPVRQLRWRELPLLALRGALLALLAFLLAQPLLQLFPTPARKWALRSPDAILTGGAEVAWRALLADGYEPHWLSPGFPSERPDSPASDLWSLLRELDASLPKEAFLAVASPATQASLRGERPVLSHPVRWIETPPPAPTHWIERFGSNADGQTVRALVGSSGPTGTHYREVVVEAQPQVVRDPNGEWSLEILAQPSGISARLGGSEAPAQKAALAARPLRFSIAQDRESLADARRLEAAFRAAARGSGRTLEAVERNADWAFRLGSSPPPDSPVNLFEYAGGTHSPLEVDTSFAAGVSLRKRVPGLGAPLLRDGFGDPIVSESLPGTPRRLSFYSRFDPEWNSWTAGGALALWLRQEIFATGDSAMAVTLDRRVAGSAQARPAQGGAALELPPPVPPPLDLTRVCAALALFLFAGERIWSHFR